MKKINCYRCEHVCRPAHLTMKECGTDDLGCAHPRYDGAAPISAVTFCPKSIKRNKHN